MRRNSEDLVNLIKNFLENKMKTKLAEKKLANFLVRSLRYASLAAHGLKSRHDRQKERIDVIDLSLGDFVPKISGVKILPQRRSTELVSIRIMDLNVCHDWYAEPFFLGYRHGARVQGRG